MTMDFTIKAEPLKSGYMNYGRGVNFTEIRYDLAHTLPLQPNHQLLNRLL